MNLFENEYPKYFIYLIQLLNFIEDQSACRRPLQVTEKCHSFRRAGLPAHGGIIQNRIGLRPASQQNYKKDMSIA